MTTHHMLLISTGGTISGNVAQQLANQVDGELERRGAESLLRAISPTSDHLERSQGVELEIESCELCDLDSSDIHPGTWMDIVKTIYDRFDDFDSFVITHGTNTLGYTCAALSFAIANSGKPIVLTGSQVPYGLPGSDALLNLENAIRVAVWSDDGHRKMRGVIAVFGSHIISGTRVKKETTFDYDALWPVQSDSIGRIGRIIKINTANLERHESYLQTNTYRRAAHRQNLRIRNAFDLNIASLTEFPGMRPEVFKILVEQHGVRGFLFRAFGAGDPAAALKPAFEQLKNAKIPIVVTTQAPRGNSNFQVNEPGQWLRQNEMAIPSYDMSIEAQTAKLGWLLAQSGPQGLSYEALCEAMVEDMRGEINVIWEIR